MMRSASSSRSAAADNCEVAWEFDIQPLLDVNSRDRLHCDRVWVPEGEFKRRIVFEQVGYSLLLFPVSPKTHLLYQAR